MATDDAIRLGNLLFTLVEPHRGHEVAYNRWYERDHFYSGCMVGAWTLAGKRFVATRDCKSRRQPSDHPGSYLALYWILDGHYDEWTRWAVDQVKWLHANGRMFPHRDHVHTQMYRYGWGAFRDDDGVPAELALDHPFSGLVVVHGEAADGVDASALERWYREDHLPSALAGSPVAMCLACAPLPIMEGAPSDVPAAEGSDRRFVHLYFLDEEPLGVWDEHFAGHGAALEEAGIGRVLFASPFLPTVPGTDRYTDELW
jgi:hypothetical protein